MNIQDNTRQATVLHIPTVGEPVPLQIGSNKPIFVLGRNGVGKSALVQWMYANIPQPVRYTPGTRISHFANDIINMTPAQIAQGGRNIIDGDRQPIARYRPQGSAQRNEIAVYELQTAEMKYKLDAVEEIKIEGKEAAAIQRLQGNTSPLDRLNALMEQGGIEVRFIIETGELIAKRRDAVFSLAKMSDGERSALVMACEILVAKPSTVFIIDEPELHLHPAIAVPLLRGLMAERPDCFFIVSTHELDIAVHSESALVVLVRGCEWVGDRVQSWDLDILEDADAVPESLRIDLYGARRKLLFVEGVSTSLDQPLYSLLFPEVSVRARETCTEVIRAVLGLRGCEEMHHASAYGMVDGDGMDAGQATKYEAQHVYSVPFYSVESIYYCREMIEALADRQAETLGADRDALIAEAYGNALGAITAENRSHLACRLSERVLRDAVLGNLPTERALVDAGDQDITIVVKSPYQTEIHRIEEFIAEGNLNAIIARYPVRESPILNEVAKALRFSRREDYEKAVLSRLTAEPELRQTLADMLGGLNPALTS